MKATLAQVRTMLMKTYGSVTGCYILGAHITLIQLSILNNETPEEILFENKSFFDDSVEHLKTMRI